MKLSNNKELLRQIIIQHYDEPSHKINEECKVQLLKDGYISFHNKSATCIDDIEVFLQIKNNIVVSAKFVGIGCAISTASTDIFCELLINKTTEKAEQLIREYKKMINQEKFDEEMLDELVAFCEIYKQANRIKCSLIGVTAIEEIINAKK